MRDDLHAAVAEAFETLVAETGLDADALFADRVLGEFEGASARAAYAAGIIEGAGIAMGMTALELMDALGVRKLRSKSESEYRWRLDEVERAAEEASPWTSHDRDDRGRREGV